MILVLAFIQNSGSQTTFQYDPWADINDDGKIDAKDIGYTCRLFGKTGDPTKNVSISDYAFRVLSYRLSIPAGGGGCLNISTAGYKLVTLHFNPIGQAISFSGIMWLGNNVTVAIGFDVGGTYELLDKFNTKTQKFVWYDDPEEFMGEPALFVRTYTIRGEKLIIGYFNPTDRQQWLDITIYLAT
jgi:hypothetical protein